MLYHSGSRLFICDLQFSQKDLKQYSLSLIFLNFFIQCLHEGVVFCFLFNLLFQVLCEFLFNQFWKLIFSYLHVNFLLFIFFFLFLEVPLNGYTHTHTQASHMVLVVGKTNAGNIRDMGSIPGVGRSLGGGNGNPLQYSCLENPMGRGAWWGTIHSITEIQIQLK